ncbi:MAG: hypothetical protein WA431_15545 [Candidatus Cybelea sp.]
MRFSQQIPTAAVAAMAMAVSAGAAMAHSLPMNLIVPESHHYSGAWPVTVSHAARGNGTYCLTLKDTGSQGWPHSGLASLTGNGSNLPYGTFQIINHILVATIQQPGAYQNAALLFVGPANNGRIGNGTFEQVYGGEGSDPGDLAFGMKGGC